MATDPGWKPILRNPAYVLIPQLGFLRMSQRGAVPVILMRLLFSAFALAVYWYIPFVLVFLFDDWTTIEPVHASVLGVISVGAFLAARWATRLPVRSENPTAAPAEHRTRLFIAIAFAESTALVGFVFAFLSESGAAYVLAAILAIPAFVIAAPTVSSVARFAAQTPDPEAFLRAMTTPGKAPTRATG